MIATFVLFGSVLIAGQARKYDKNAMAEAFFAEATPIPADQCKSVNASEPDQCPQTIGPPCPNCYTNERPLYKSGDSLSFSASELSDIESHLDTWIQYWADNYPPSLNEPFGAYDLFTGLAGRGHIYLKLYSLNYKNNQDEWLKTAEAYLDHALSIMPQKQTYPSYFFGQFGVWATAAIIAEITGDEANIANYQQKMQDVVATMIGQINSGVSNDPYRLDVGGIDEGIAGLIYGCLYTNEYFSSDIIGQNDIMTLAKYVVQLGLKNGAKFGNNYMMYECPFISGCYMIGMGHGNGGVIHMLFEVNRVTNGMVMNDPTMFQAITNTLNQLVSMQLPDGNMPTAVNGSCASDYGTDPDMRVQWCHGAPGFVDVFTEAAVIYNDLGNVTESKNYLSSGLFAAEAVWTRGLLVKGLMYCHGIGGNTYMLWKLYENLQRLPSSMVDTDTVNSAAWQAKQFILWTLNDVNLNALRCKDSNENYSMFQGCPGIVLLYAQAIQDGWPMNVHAKMPGWDVRF